MAVATDLYPLPISKCGNIIIIYEPTVHEQ